MKLFKGFVDTFSILAVKWESIKSVKTKIIIIFCLAAFLFFLYLTANAGAIVIFLSQNMPEGESEEIQTYIITFLNTFSSGQLNLYVTGVLGATVGMILISPFSGYSISGVVPSRDLIIVKNNDNHRISDSIIVQLLSTLTIIQLISLTLLSSLLTIEGGTGPAVLYSWSLWIAIVFISVAFLWITEYVNRKYGMKVKIAIIVFIVGVIATAILLDPFKGSTFFGLSPIIIDILQNIYLYSFWQTIGAYSIPLIITVVFAGLLIFFASHALNLQEPLNIKRKKALQEKRLKKIEAFSEISLFRTMSLLIFRYKVIWRPILITTVFSLGLTLILGGSNLTGQNIFISLTIIIPLVVSLAFGVNMFGIIGSANIWLASNPQWRTKVVYNIIALQLTVIAAIYLIIMLVSTILGRTDIAMAVNAIPGMCTAATAITVFAVSKSLKQPIKYMPSSRGDSILPPLTMLNYMLKIMLIGGLAGSPLFWIPLDYQYQTAAILCAIFGYIFYRQNKKWNEKEEQLNLVVKNTTID